MLNRRSTGSWNGSRTSVCSSNAVSSPVAAPLPFVSAVAPPLDDGVFSAECDSTDDRIASLSLFQELLRDAVESEESEPHEHAGKEFDAVEYSDTVDDIPPEDEIVDTVSSPPSDAVSSAPSGPSIQHEDQRFAVVFETWERCDARVAFL